MTPERPAGAPDHAPEAESPPRASGARPAADLDRMAREWVVGLRPLGLIILDPKTGESVRA